MGQSLLPAQVNGGVGIKTSSVAIVIDGGGVAIVAGSKLAIPNLPAGVITDWALVADQSGSIQLDLKKAAYADFPTTVSITASAKPILSAARKAASSTLTGWTTAVAAGDVLEVVVDSAATITYAVITLTLNRAS